MVENYGGYNWHVISDDGENVTLLMDSFQLPYMNHCTNDTDASTDCAVDSTGEYYVYSWDKSLIQTYLNGEFYSDLSSKIVNEIVPQTICNDPSNGADTSYSYGGYLQSELDSLNKYYGENSVTCNSYSNYNVRLITISEYYNLTPYHSSTTLPFDKTPDIGNKGKVALISIITRVSDSSWLYADAGNWWSMSSGSQPNSATVRSARYVRDIGMIDVNNSENSRGVRPVITVKK